jgi:predicted nucleic acid-binding protein
MNRSVRPKRSAPMKLIRIHYLDASAIVKLFITEEGSDRLQTYFGEESNFHATSLCFAEALGALKVKRFYRKEISDEQYFCACEELLAYGADNTIEIEDVEIKDPMVFVEVENLVRKYQKTIDVSDAFQIVSVKRNYFSRFECDSKPILITGDKALAIAARQEGIRVWDCVNEPEPTEVLQA